MFDRLLARAHAVDQVDGPIDGDVAPSVVFPFLATGSASRNSPSS